MWVCFQLINQSFPLHINIWKCFGMVCREIKLFINWNSFRWVCTSWNLDRNCPWLWISVRVLEYVFFDPNRCLHDCKAFHMQCMRYKHNLHGTFIYDLWWYRIRLWWLLNKSSLMKTYFWFFLKKRAVKDHLPSLYIWSCALALHRPYSMYRRWDHLIIITFFNYTPYLCVSEVTTHSLS